MENIINESQIFKILEKTKKPACLRRQNLELARKIITKAKNLKGLNLEEVGVLLDIEDEDLIKEMKKTAFAIKKAIYGNRLVLFAPLYVSSFCVNDCQYCGFHRSNLSHRKKLSLEEVKSQVEILEEMGHKRLLLEFGEDPVNNPIDYVVEVIKAIYNIKKGKGAIRRVNVNIAAATCENYKKLKKAGIGTYQLFQETYHRKTYEKLHSGPKADYTRQITALNRAFEAGIDDLGIGVLFGLYDFKFEVLALISHTQYLEKKYGVGPHTISVPRFKSADSVNYQPEYEVSDKDFLKLISILRLAVPYTGMIMSTRETPEIRREAFKLGISQTSAGSCTMPGGYRKNPKSEIRNPKQIQNSKLVSSRIERFKILNKFQNSDLNQFSLHDHRSLDEVVYDICQMGYLPSFCTACYRVGRTGDKFMEYAKSGRIQDFCQPNAILTFKEYLEDYALDRTKKTGEKVILKETERIKNDIIENKLKERLTRIEAGKRDLYF